VDTSKAHSHSAAAATNESLKTGGIHASRRVDAASGCRTSSSAAQSQQQPERHHTSSSALTVTNIKTAEAGCSRARRPYLLLVLNRLHEVVHVRGFFPPDGAHHFLHPTAHLEELRHQLAHLLRQGNTVGYIIVNLRKVTLVYTSRAKRRYGKNLLFGFSRVLGHPFPSLA
jgi:hypothetical protein